MLSTEAFAKQRDGRHIGNVGERHPDSAPRKILEGHTDIFERQPSRHEGTVDRVALVIIGKTTEIPCLPYSVYSLAGWFFQFREMRV